MIAQFVSFLFCSLCFIVIGALIKRVTKWHISYHLDFIIGVCNANAFFTLISIFHCLNSFILSIFTVTLLGLIIFNKSWLGNYFYRLNQRFLYLIKNQIILTSVTLLFVVLTFFQSLYAPTLHYDAALYHIPNIKWIAEYPTVYGLAHININFGYNFNIFSLYAPFTFYSIFGQYIFSINLIITCLFIAWLFSAFRNALQNNNYQLCISYLLIIYYLIENYWYHVSTPSNDIIIFILVILILTSFANSNKNTDVVFPLFILSLYTITIKLSAGPILLITFYIFFQKHFWNNTRKAAYTLLIAGFVLLPWLCKNIIITGWLLFPFSDIDLFNVDWKIAIEDVLARKELIRNFYMPNRGVIQDYWLKAWFLTQTQINRFTILTTLLLIGLISKIIIKKEINLSRSYITAILISIVGILYILLNSPSLRYSIAFFLTTITLITNVMNTKQIIAKYIFYLSSIILVSFFLKENWYHPWHFLKNINQRIILPYSYDKLVTKKFDYFLIDNRIKCYYPTGSDQCYNQNLPCAPTELQRVHLRGNTIKEGFYKDYVTTTSEKTDETHY